MQLGWLVEVADVPASAAAIAALADAERDGFDAIWLSAERGGAHAALLLAAALADATERVRIGVAASPSASFHPLRLAEDLAMVDVVSAGRLDWICPRAADGDASGTAARVLGAWRGEALAAAGGDVGAGRLVLAPHPVQRPHPCVWLPVGMPRPRLADPALAGVYGEDARAPDAGEGSPRAWIRRAQPDGADAVAHALREHAPEPGFAGARSLDWLIVALASPAADARRARSERQRFVEAIRAV